MCQMTSLYNYFTSSAIIEGVLLLLAVGDVTSVTSPCEDIDPVACPALAAQNPNLCNEPGLATVACPRFCKKCPLRCFDCLVTDVKRPWCSNTTECSKGEQCMIRELQSSADGHGEILMQCASVQICDMVSTSAGFIGKRDVSIHCCKDDLCNMKNITRQSTVTTKDTPTSTTTTSTTRRLATTPTPYPTPPTPTTSTTTPTPPTTKPTTLPPGCSVDITILIEDSASRGLSETLAITEFLKDTVDKLQIGLQYNKVAVSLFSNDVNPQWPFDSREAMDKPTMMAAIDNLHFRYSTDVIKYDHVSTYLNQLSNPTITKNRFGVKHVVLIIADNDTVSQQFRGQHYDVDKIIYISIGRSAFVGSFHNIAQNTRHMLTVAGPDVGTGLKNIQMNLLTSLCDSYYIRN